MALAPPLQQVDRTWVLSDGRRLSYFGGCDYFRLSSHPRVIAALHAGAERLGLNVAASRATTGNHEVFGKLEQQVAEFFGSPSALVTASGYVTNMVVLQALGRDYQHAFIDERSHPSLLDAARFLECETVPFPHRSPADLAAKLAKVKRGQRVLLMTDGLFSHDGSVAPVREYLGMLPSNGMLLVDDAHGAGVLGRDGRGTVEHERVSRGRVIQTISLSKAFGAYGGAILCSRALRERIIEGSRLYSGNTPLPLPLAAAAVEGVRQLGAHAEWRERMNKNASRVKEALRKGGVDVPNHPAPIVALTPETPAQAAALRKALLAHDVFPSHIRYPGGPASGYFRLMISSEHSRKQLDALVEGVLSAKALHCSARIR